MKKVVCFIGQNESTCRFISAHLLKFLQDYIDVRTWCLQHSKTLPDYCMSDIYIASTHTILKSVENQLPPNKARLVAARTINIENLDKLLAIEPNTKVLVIGTSHETSLMAVDIIQSFGITYLSLIPYYPSQITPPPDITLAISTGLNHLVPRTITQVIDLGVKSIDISTFVELIDYLNVPKEVLNEISHYYIEAILQVTLKLQGTARMKETLKREMEVILNTVNEAIIAINQQEEVVLLNPAAEKLFEISADNITGKILRDVLPQIDVSACLETGESIVHDIKRVKDGYFIFSASPLTNDAGDIRGVVITTRPVNEVEELETKVRRTLRRKGHNAKHNFGEIIGHSSPLLKSVELAKRFAKTGLTVLLEGESGTGKELFAQAIHNHSTRQNGPFVAINFAALPENLVESELFGYEDGAFTGAKKGGKQGLFEEAHLGTIFLDEIGDATLNVQKKLLRVLEEREVRRVGGSIVTPIDVRVIAATNQNLEEMVQKGEFRKDLFYRICTLPVYIPPLRERSEDIVTLINYFVKKTQGCNLSLETPLQDFLIQYNWPGNIRELQNVVRYMCSIVMHNSIATIKDLPSYMARSSAKFKNNEASFRPYTNVRFESVVREMELKNVLELVAIILDEVRHASTLNKGLGRQALMKRLNSKQQVFPEHKIRYWLKTLAEMGYIDAGITRQGSKITKSGEELYIYIERRMTNPERSSQ